MPLSFVDADTNGLCALSQWSVKAHGELIKILAWLYMRRVTHAERIINGLEPGYVGRFGLSRDGAIRNLRYNVVDIQADLASHDSSIRQSAEKKRDVRISHRDGLLFQHISWIAAKLQFPSAEASPPHVRKADKGFDGFFVDFDSKQTDVSRVIICEDKASISPRGLVTSSIWPEMKEIYDGNRDTEVLDAILPLLKRMPEEDREAAVNRIIWERARHFRVSLTAGDDQIKNGRYGHLFEGFDDHAGGDTATRLAGVMPMTDVRQYLNEIAEDVIIEVEKNF